MGDVLSVIGEMVGGQFHGAGMLLYDGIVIYAGNWDKGSTSSNGKELRGSVNMHPAQLLQLYLYREMVYIRNTFPTK